MLIAIFVVVAVLRKRRGHQRRTEGLAFLPSLMDRLRIAIRISGIHEHLRTPLG
jgi:hypothetical protein